MKLSRITFIITLFNYAFVHFLCHTLFIKVLGTRDPGSLRDYFVTSFLSAIKYLVTFYVIKLDCLSLVTKSTSKFLNEFYYYKPTTKSKTNNYIFVPNFYPRICTLYSTSDDKFYIYLIITFLSILDLCIVFLSFYYPLFCNRLYLWLLCNQKGIDQVKNVLLNDKNILFGFFLYLSLTILHMMICFTNVKKDITSKDISLLLLKYFNYFSVAYLYMAYPIEMETIPRAYFILLRITAPLGLIIELISLYYKDYKDFGLTYPDRVVQGFYTQQEVLYPIHLISVILSQDIRITTIYFLTIWIISFPIKSRKRSFMDFVLKNLEKHKDTEEVTRQLTE
jgi:hypothetical protein